MSKFLSYVQLLLKHLVCDNIFISLVAVCMSWGTNSIFHLTLDPNYYLVLFFATLSSYSLHWYFTDITIDQIAISTNQFRNRFNNKKVLIYLFIFSSVGFVYYLILHQDWIIYLLPAMIATLIYSAPKFPIKKLKNLEGKALAKTFYLAAVWIYTTNIVPFLISKQSIIFSIIIYLIANFIFIYVICLLFDYRDQHKDQMKFILINTNKHFDKIIIALTIVFSFLIGLLVLLKLPLHIIFGLSSCYVFLLATISFSKRTRSDYWFYLVLDGLMCLPSLLGILMHCLFNK